MRLRFSVFADTARVTNVRIIIIIIIIYKSTLQLDVCNDSIQLV